MSGLKPGLSAAVAGLLGAAIVTVTFLPSLTILALKARERWQQRVRA